MSKGFVIFAQNSQSGNYLEMAYALAMTIKASQSFNNVTLVTNDHVLPEMKEVFDHILDFPWGDAAWHSDDHKIDNMRTVIHISPYDETIVLDADMIFTADTDIDSQWDFFSNYHAIFTTSPLTYHGKPIENKQHRLTFTDNHLPDIHTAFFYFQKTTDTYKLFESVTAISENWRDFYRRFTLITSRSNVQSNDINFAIGLSASNLKNTPESPTAIPNFVDMVPAAQKDTTVGSDSDWRTYWDFQFNDNGELFVSNHRISAPFHYRVKNWITPTIMEDIKKWYNTKKR